MEPASWHPSTYELDAGLGLAVCVRHCGVHRWYLDGCHALPAPQSRLERIRIYRAGLETARTEPIRAEVDAPALAEGIAAAIYGLMARRQQARDAEAHAFTPAAPTNGRGQAAPADRSAVEVWADDRDP